MGALPKNKITSVERGKRRAGNTPKLKVNDKKKKRIAKHKRSFFAMMENTLGKLFINKK